MCMSACAFRNLCSVHVSLKPFAVTVFCCGVFIYFVCRKMAADQLSDNEWLPNTLTPTPPTHFTSTPTEIERNVPTVIPWGRLLACKQFLKSVDLVESFSFGRAPDCSVIVTSGFCQTKQLFNISKKHFQIDKCPEDNLIYITDFSKNGTYINSIKIGLGNRRILKTNDVIAVSLPSNAVYKFINQIVEGTDEFLPTELVGRFANVRLLGRGSCGEVRLVKDRVTFEYFAVKKIILSENRSSQIHKINHPTKISNEIMILKSLQHPCIISMSDTTCIGQEVYLVLKYMSGGELSKRIPMTEDLAKFYFIQLLHAVHYLHSSGVIHRDLKPENILLLDNRKETLLKISDFGLSKVTYQNDATTMCGTLRYVAPEVINNKFRDYGEYGKEVDVWSLGVILYFLISQDFPFKGEDNYALAKSIETGKFDLSNGVWSDPDKGLVKDLLEKMLRLLPKNRIKISKIFDHDWIKLAHGVKFRVKKLLEEEGLENPMQDLLLEPSPKKFRFNNVYSSSSDESNTTLTGMNGFPSSPTLCC